MFEDLSEDAIRQANQLLAFLTSRANPDWEKVLDKALDASELDLNTANATKALERFDLKAPVGAVFGGTGQAKEEAGLSGEDSQRAVRLLKQAGRLLQAGKGRGKALLILSSKPLDASDFTAPVTSDSESSPETSESSEDANLDVSQLLKTANAAHRALATSHTQALKTIELREDMLRQAEDRIAQLEARVTELTDELAAKETLSQVTYWQ